MDIKKIIINSNLFDKNFYLKEYRDARLADQMPIDHYCEVGIKEDRKPNASYDPIWYRKYYADVKADGIYPLVHYILHGIKEHRLINEKEKNEYEALKIKNFDVDFYKNNYEDLKKTEENFDFLLHYIRYGRSEGRVIENKVIEQKILVEKVCCSEDSQIELVLLEDSKLKSLDFDINYYLENNKDVANTEMDPELHYYEFGEREGRKPNEFFNPDFYSQLNADVRTAGISPFTHYCDDGFREGRLGAFPCDKKQRKISTSVKPLLFVGHDAILAGAQVVLLEVVRWFYLHTNREIKILLLGTGAMLNSYLEFGEVYVLHDRQVDDVEKFKFFLNEEFEFVYLNTVVSGCFLKIIRENSIELYTDFIANIHEMEKVLDIYRDELSELLPEVKHWISGSPESTEVLIEKYKVDSEKLTTVPAFINPIANKEARFNELKVEARNTLNLDQEAFIVTGCGTAYWRKGPDIFVETAKKLKKITNKKIQFVWIGDGEDKDKIESSLTQEEQAFIKFVGHQTNANLLLATGDIFFLSSREDPFPLVVLLSAQHHIPTVCFEEATGITQFVKDDAGICLPSIDPELAANAIYKLIENSELLNKFGITAHERVFSSYTAEQKMIEIFNVIKENTSYKPSVSVVVPFYNHEEFIDERLNSILNQNIKDIEIIALDDCSTDNSVLTVEKYLTDPRVKVYTNATNSGSPFKQWKKGIELAKSDVIWIAEGDDSCSTNFISQLLPYFDDSLINIAYARTEMINENGDIQAEVFKPYFDKAYAGKFDSSYVRTGIEEVNEQLGAMCTLVNASGLMIRKSSLGETLNEAENFKMCGDWLIYLECLKNGKIAYDINAINYFRRHSASQVKKVEGTSIYFNERSLITGYVFSNFTTTKQLRIKAFDEVDSEWERFKYKNSDSTLHDYYDKKKLLNIAKETLKNRLPSIIVVTSDLAPGGGQVFSIRLANAWKRIGGEVILLNVNIYPSHPEVLKKIDKNIKVFNSSEIDLKEICNVYGTDIIHSSIWWADKYVHENITKLPEKVKWVLTMHGCYETLVENLEIDKSFLSFFQKMQYEVNHWVYIAEKNKLAFQLTSEPENLSKVFNGYEYEAPKELSEKSIGIRKNSFVFCLVSRAMESKGWIVACEAIKELNIMGYTFDLVLIGDGEAVDIVKENYDSDYIHLTGQISNVEDYVAIADVGILPSSFIGESMPLVLIEYMAQGKPMISTNVGEIVNMTTDEEGDGALILKLIEGKVQVDDLSEAMVRIYENKELYKSLSYNSKRRFKTFDMKDMIENYKNIYLGLIHEK